MLTNDTPFSRVASLSIFPCLESLGCWIPHHQSDSWHPHGVCLIVGDEGNGTVSGFVLRPLGGPDSPYFQSSYPCLIVGAVSWFTLISSPLALTRSLPPPCARAPAPRHHIPPISAHVVVVPPLTDNVKYIDCGPRFSFPQQVHPVPLDVLPSPLSSCLQKQEIIQNDPANRSYSLLPALALLLT
jgi:hypothetical protein